MELQAAIKDTLWITKLNQMPDPVQERLVLRFQVLESSC
jgi:hypothetical protein